MAKGADVDWSKTVKPPQADPLGEITFAIGRASLSCLESLDPHLESLTDKKKVEARFLITFEFMYFFAHMVNRTAFSILGPERRDKLLNQMGPLVAPPIIDAFSHHWPSELKARMVEEFCEKMDIAEIEYSSCKANFDKRITGDGLFDRLALNVAELAGRPKDLAIVGWAVAHAFTQCNQLKLNEKVEAAGKLL